MLNIEEDDIVFHRPTRETWVVKRIGFWVPYQGWLEWKGWPPGRAQLTDCLLVEKNFPAHDQEPIG